MTDIKAISALENSIITGSERGHEALGNSVQQELCANRSLSSELPAKSTQRPSLLEEKLLLEMLNDTPSAIENLLSRNYPIVYRTAYRLTGNFQDAEDVAQEAMLHAFLNIRRFRKECRFSSWLVAIAVNSALSLKRKRRRIQWTSLDEPTQPNGTTFRIDNLPDDRPNPEQKCRDGELRQLLRYAVANQPTKFRDILSACVLNETPIEEVAHTLNITRAAAKSRLFRARKVLLSATRRQFEIGGRR